MPAAATNQRQRASPFEIWLELVEARALLVSHGDLPLIEAIDGLQEIAVRQRLVKTLGQDRIQQILCEAFREVPYE